MNFKKALLPALISAVTTPAFSAVDQNEAAQIETLEEVIVTGTRRQDRTVTQSVVPIDVFSSEDLIRQGTSDTNALFQALIPSFSVAQNSISGGTSFVRPPNLRGLPPDQTLVLVNGKRRHRSAMINTDVGANSLLSQAVDLAQIPAVAIKRVEVLRDGASAQYGSDAIAGVINIVLKDDNSGFSGGGRLGQYYAGDGEDYQLAFNTGFAVGDNGFINVSAEYVNGGPTSRGTQRPGALQLSQERPDLNIPDPVQDWGKTEMDVKRLFVNSAFDIGDSEVYFFGNYGVGDGTQNFNYRQPFDTANFNRTGLFNVTYYLDELPNGNRDATGATFNFADMLPNGFKPIFSGEIDDIAGTIGFRGQMGELNYDFSASHGQNELSFSLANTLNPSFGPDTPTSFHLGKFTQKEQNLNADFSYPVDLGLASPLNIAWGVEYRREEYEIGLGDTASWSAGPFARQVVENPDGSTFVVTSSVGSNGSRGKGPRSVGTSSRKNYAFYIDLETDVTSAFTIGAAARYEDFNTFGGTSNVKGSARYEFSSTLAVRGAVSTGFHAPSPGQTDTSNVTLNFEAGSTTPVQTGTYAVSNPAAIYYGAKDVEPEESLNLTAGVVITPASGINLTVDYYNIRIEDRLGLSRAFSVTSDDRTALAELGVADANELNRVQYLTNAFDTRTQGIDAVLTKAIHTDNAGTFNTSLSLNWNKTKVIDRDPVVVSDARVATLEKVHPKLRVNLTETWEMGPFSLLTRVNYYDKYTVTANSGAAQTFGEEVVVDLEGTYQFNDNFSFSFGAQNLFDNFPDKDLRSIDPNTGLPGNGNQYIDVSPFGYNGGFWYIRTNVDF
ncbi:TonB-dependent receptor plug domain-containing protein [Sedimenticola sp.]|uniref:TonB-dependent receptor plug domain-containing protein n=1 Tax=Sedimenticola sp. TaxID=1940285 RepID=UPI003D10AA3A